MGMVPGQFDVSVHSRRNGAFFVGRFFNLLPKFNRFIPTFGYLPVFKWK
ncbi:hypothetical protein HMPREF9413_3523 [Paenibacillus sp. HGF7]|nr:hypothetical protein HMPREF9413_3523 [Paenibacillus sp. HGF7]